VVENVEMEFKNGKEINDVQTIGARSEQRKFSNVFYKETAKQTAKKTTLCAKKTWFIIKMVIFFTKPRCQLHETRASQTNLNERIIFPIA